METRLLAGFKVKLGISCRPFADVGDPTLRKPSPVARLILRTAAADAKPDHDHWNQQPKEGEYDYDHSKRMHEPRLAEIAQVLIDEPEHPAEEHESYEFSQCVDHGRGLYHFQVLADNLFGE